MLHVLLGVPVVHNGKHAITGISWSDKYDAIRVVWYILVTDFSCMGSFYDIWYERKRRYVKEFPLKGWGTAPADASSNSARRQRRCLSGIIFAYPAISNHVVMYRAFFTLCVTICTPVFHCFHARVCSDAEMARPLNGAAFFRCTRHVPLTVYENRPVLHVRLLRAMCTAPFHLFRFPLLISCPQACTAPPPDGHYDTDRARLAAPPTHDRAARPARERCMPRNGTVLQAHVPGALPVRSRIHLHITIAHK